MLRDLLAAHDNDIRYGTAAGRSRIATMYFPLLSIVMQHSGILFKDSTPASDSGGVFERSGESRRSVVIRDDEKVGPRASTTSAVCWLVEWLWCDIVEAHCYFVVVCVCL